jgi:hypothetical protein
MAKKMVFICDGSSCGAILVNPSDGFVLRGSIRATALEEAGALAPLVTTGENEETALCRECMMKALKL